MKGREAYLLRVTGVLHNMHENVYFAKDYTFDFSAEIKITLLKRNGNQV